MAKRRLTAADCLTCGACCVTHYDQNVYVDVNDADMERLGKRWTRLHVIQPTTFDLLVVGFTDAAIETKRRTIRRGPLKGTAACVCVALSGDPMHRVRCSVYERRPQVCREGVKPGDTACRQARADLDL